MAFEIVELWDTCNWKGCTRIMESNNPKHPTFTLRG